MKKILLILGTALLFLNTIAIPTITPAEGPGGTSCPQGPCKP